MGSDVAQWFDSLPGPETITVQCKDGRGTIEFTVLGRHEKIADENGLRRALRDSSDICIWWTESGIRRCKQLRYEEALRHLGLSLLPQA